MSDEHNEVKRWTARRKATAVMDMIKGQVHVLMLPLQTLEGTKVYQYNSLDYGRNHPEISLVEGIHDESISASEVNGNVE